tara:strand:- start:34 stop:495 length:462 start_codon:yes stop_codon:yes gene_type:complete
MLQRFLLAFSALVVLTGCLGSPEGYRPGYQERPVQETLESAEARALRLAVPVEIDREDTHLTYTRKEVARIMGERAPNSWNSYEWELDDELNRYVENHGPGFGARPILGRRPVLRPDETRKADGADAAGEAGESGESGETEGGDEETTEDYGY